MKQKTTNNKISKKTTLVDDNTVSHNGSSKKIKQEKNKEKSQFSHLYVVGYTLFHKRASFLFPRLERITESLEQAMMPIPKVRLLVAREDAHHLLRNIDLFGVDILSALADLRNRTTCDAYSELLDGLVSTIHSGGSMKSFFISAAIVQMTEKKMKLRKKIASLGVITEMYTILLIVAPLMGIIMLSIMAIMSTSFAGMDITSLVALLSYLMVPMFGFMLLLMIDSMVPKR